ncbi:MAG: signal peptide peptidase SppA [Gammaproteobacteria bacterium]|nr:MAG: signal peptide peptidase SppA [Gammaproteobacteria bacterium]
MDSQQPNWEQRTIEKIALQGIKEQKRARRWNIFFKILFFLYLTAIVASFFIQSKEAQTYDIFGQKSDRQHSQHIALVRLKGTIAADEAANAEALNSTLRRAAANHRVKGILLLANSPGGSPVQSSVIYKTIREIKKNTRKPILTVVTDVCASGCYYIASASDEIYADESSIVGSIGVISQSFGYGEAAKKLGLDPRTFTAGKNKDFMNPAKPLKPEDIAFIKTLLDDLHQNFIQAVKTGRGDKLADNPDLFSGLFWAGKKAQALGLIDGIDTPAGVAKRMGNYPVYDYMQKDAIEKVLEKLGVEAKTAVTNGIHQAVIPNNRIEFK